MLQARSRFGDVRQISKVDWIKEVTEASKDVWVLVHLFQDSVVECQLVSEAFDKLARQFPYVKFLKIKSTHAVENWPDRNLPTIFAYHEGVLKHQVLTLAKLYGKSMKPSGNMPTR